MPGPDGQVDTTGVNFLNLTNVLVQRDNSRQAIADIIALIRTLPTIDIDPGTNPGPDFDGDRIHVIGYSLGGTHAGTVIGLLGAEVKASALPSAAAMLTETIKQSATFGPLIEESAGRERRAGRYNALPELFPQCAGGIRCGGYGQLRVDDGRP